MSDPDKELFAAIGPLLDAIGGDPVAPDEIMPGDIPIEWDGEVIGAIRLPPLSHALELLVARIETELGASLSDLDRVGKQKAVRMLDEQGAFLLRQVHRVHRGRDGSEPNHDLQLPECHQGVILDTWSTQVDFL